MSFFHLLVGLIIAQRLAELAFASRNTRKLLARGGREVGAGHYPLLVLVHAAWLATMVLTIPGDAEADPFWLSVFALLLTLRIWVIASLGPFWTTRIITVPNAPLIRGGPYRWLRHPNYFVVAGEIAVVPMAFGAWGVALAFSVANAVLLAYRIHIEDRALALRPAGTGQPPSPW